MFLYEFNPRQENDQSNCLLVFAENWQNAIIYFVHENNFTQCYDVEHFCGYSIAYMNGLQYELYQHEINSGCVNYGLCKDLKGDWENIRI